MVKKELIIFWNEDAKYDKLLTYKKFSPAAYPCRGQVEYSETLVDIRPLGGLSRGETNQSRMASTSTL